MAAGDGITPDLPEVFAQADVVILGEVHDNPVHHAIQTIVTAQLRPTALVFEMFGPEVAAELRTLEDRDSATMAEALAWDGTGWPDFALYYPVFEAAPEAAVVGAALPSDQVRAAVEAGAAAVFGEDAARFGLDRPLPAAEQSARETLQAAAHCNALPATLLPGMVEAQRLRDAAFARSALQALDTYGAPVVVITGTGHARHDWGIPAAIARAAPDVTVASLGQGEVDHAAPPKGRFDLYTTAPPVERSDPCTAFH